MAAQSVPRSHQLAPLSKAVCAAIRGLDLIRSAILPPERPTRSRGLLLLRTPGARRRAFVRAISPIDTISSNTNSNEFTQGFLHSFAHSGERDQPYRLKVIADSGDRDHADHGRQRPGVMVATLHAADISVGCMGIVGPVKSAADRPRSPWRGPRAPRSALASDGAARAGRRCGPPWAIGARAVMQRGFRQRQDVGARMVP